MTRITYFNDAFPDKKGTVQTVAFELDGQEFAAMNGGPMFPFTEAISLVVNCENQQEIDEYWNKLSAGGKEVQCGWLKDKYGLLWQVVPTRVFDMLADPDPARSGRAMMAVMNMVKLDLPALEAAFRG